MYFFDIFGYFSQFSSQFNKIFKVFSGEDLGPIQRRFNVLTSDQLPPPGDGGGEAGVQAEAGEDDGNLPQELLQEVRLKDV